MRFTYNWLKEYLPELNLPVKELAQILTMSGIPVESLQSFDDDWIFEVEVASNRPDLLGVLGIAKELGVILSLELKNPQMEIVEADKSIEDIISVRVEVPHLCSIYTARAVLDVKIDESPLWLQKRLTAMNLRPINNVVDITNYVLFEVGQPLHAFDLRFLIGAKIIVRTPKEGEKLLAINDKEYELPPDCCVIADEKYPVAIGGVMGGKDSQIISTTRDVIIESAMFDKVNIRNTSRKIALSTESSYRFERGVNPNTVELASLRAASLMCKYAGGKVAKGIINISALKKETTIVKVRPSRVVKILGYQVSPQQVEKILVAMGCKIVQKSEEAFIVEPPDHRQDLKSEIDFIEEVARVENYQKIPSDYDMGIFPIRHLPEDIVAERVKSLLLKLGFDEVLTKSFVDQKFSEDFRYWSKESPISLIDPRGRLKETLRKSVLPCLIEVLRNNEVNWQELKPLFEIAKIYFKQGEEFLEKNILGLVAPQDFYIVKGAVEKIMSELQIPFSLKKFDQEFLEPATGVEVIVDEEPIGFLCILNTQLCRKFDLRTRPAVAELDFEKIVARANLRKSYKEITRMPPVFRDIAIVVDEEVSWQKIEEVTRASAGEILESVWVFDIYRGEQIEKGKKSIAFSLVFRDKTRTLSGDEIQQKMDKIIQNLKNIIGATLR